MVERAFPAAAIPSAGARSITTPFQFLVSGEDNLRVRVWDSAAGQTLIVSGRAVDRDGTIGIFNQPILLTGIRSVQTKVFKLAPGYVLSVSAEMSGGTVEHGQCFIQVDLVRGFDGPLTTLGTLLQGYVASTEGLAYPGSPITTPFDGPGYVRVIQGAIPAPGAQIAEAGPSNAVWQVRHFRSLLTTDATVADRYAFLILQDGSSRVIWFAPSIFAQPAGLVRGYNWAPGVIPTANAGANNLAIPLPSPHRLNATMVIRSGNVGAGPADQWGQPTFVVEEWINPWV